MFLSNKIQRIAFCVFFLGLILSVVNLVCLMNGLSLPTNIKPWIVIILDAMIMLSALVAPFTKEKNETRYIKLLRLRAISVTTAIYFVLITVTHALRIVLIWNDSTALSSAYDWITSWKCIILFEILYFIFLKSSINNNDES